MNPKIEVDHKLFTTCRLCLDEKGKYQIVPAIQKNIKFAFDIEVELNNGLPQLICVNCESLLSQFVCTKQLFQEKQKTLKRRQQVTVSPEPERTQSHRESENSPQPTDNEQYSETEHETFTATDVISGDNCDDNIRAKIVKRIKISRDKSWRRSFIKHFGCRFCSKIFKEKRSINSHIQRHNQLLLKFKNNISPCFVKVEKIDQKPNITGSKKFVMFNVNKIMQNKKDYYYVIYSSKSHTNCTTSSDEDEKITNKKSKRRRLDSGSSHDTLVIEEKVNENDTDMETTKIDFRLKGTDFDSNNVTIESETESEDKDKNMKGNKVVIDNIITVCHNKILSKIEKDCSPNFKSKSDKQSQLRHKVLSIGSKILNNNRLNCTGLLRYLEYKNLDVIPKINHSNDTNFVRIHTKIRGKKEPKNNSISWKNLNNASNIDNMPVRDFFNTLNEALNSERCSEEKSGSTSNVILNKLLNANPVANPKQLPKKSVVELSTSVQNSFENGDANNIGLDKSVHNITSKHNDSVIENNGPSACTIDGNKREQITYPRIKVKPVSELMSGTKSNEVNASSFVCYSGPHSFQGSSTSNVSKVASQPIKTNYSRSINNSKSVPNYINIAPAVPNIAPAVPNIAPVVPNIAPGIPNTAVTTHNIATAMPKTPQSHIGTTYTSTREFPNSKKNPEHIILHTVEFPNTQTKSPFQYFRNLLQLHNIGLVDSKAQLPYQSKCLIKFKLSFHQEEAIPVTLCLSLFSNVETFCVGVTNNDDVYIDVNKMSAYWQWEILRAFRGEVVPQLLKNASNIHPTMLEATKKFINYLKSIEPILLYKS